MVSTNRNIATSQLMPCKVAAADRPVLVCCCMQGMFPAPDDALSWQELKLAAEAGFEELLRMQEAAAAAANGQQASPARRRPGMTRATGGGGSTADPCTGPLNMDWAGQGVYVHMRAASQLSVTTMFMMPTLHQKLL